MKRNNYIILLFLLLLTITGCKKKQESDDIIIRKPQTQVHKGPASMAGEDREANVKWLGSVYHITIARRADSTQTVADNGSQKTYDNRVTLRILRKDGSTFMDKTFTQKDFTERVSQDYPKGSVLLSLFYDKVEGDNLCFVASIGLPDALSDEYVPLQVKVNRMGSISVSKMQEQ